MSLAEKAQVSSLWLDLLDQNTAQGEWVYGFKVVLRDSGILVGQCGFKGPPDCEGRVEIAYSISLEHQGKGYATEAARALVRHAFEYPSVKVVIAHTLPEPGPSPRVLTKSGFARVGEVMDPEDGLVWRWQIERTPLKGAQTFSSAPPSGAPNP